MSAARYSAQGPRRPLSASPNIRPTHKYGSWIDPLAPYRRINGCQRHTEFSDFIKLDVFIVFPAKKDSNLDVYQVLYV